MSTLPKRSLALFGAALEASGSESSTGRILECGCVCVGGGRGEGTQYQLYINGGRKEWPLTNFIMVHIASVIIIITTFLALSSTTHSFFSPAVFRYESLS